jgi:hypothetical protein
LRPAISCTCGNGGRAAGAVQIVLDGEILAEIRKQQNRERQAGFVQRKLGVLGVALALLHLNLRLDDVGVRRPRRRAPVVR